MSETSIENKKQPLLQRYLLFLGIVGGVALICWIAFQRSYWVQSRIMRTKTSQELEAIIAQNPNSVMAQFHLGHLYYEANRFQEAALCFGKVVAINPRWDIARYDNGLTLFRLTQFKEAQEQFESALRINATLTPATFMLGYTLLAQGRVGESFELMRGAIRQKPKERLYHWSYGYNLLRMNQWEEAIPVLEEALELGIREPDIHLALGQAYLLKGEVEGAKKHLDATLHLRPNSVPAVALRNACDINSALDASTLQRIERSLKAGLKSDSVYRGQFWFYLGRVYSQSGKAREAYDAYRNALHSDYTEEFLFFGLSEVTKQMGKEHDSKVYREEYERLQSVRNQLSTLAQHVMRLNDDADASLALARDYRSFQFREKTLTEYDHYLRLHTKDKSVLAERNAYFQRVKEALRQPSPLSVLPKLL